MYTNVKFADAYYRLSIEEAAKSESGSITNQKNIVRKYCKDNNIVIVKEFVDDGYSGSNFDRPAFKQMLEHIKTGLVNTVITKDLSRLGRDMTESSNYAERFFPENGIHYIAISDNFDSEQTNLMAPFQFAMNDVYLRDTSRKIKQVLENKREQGEYCACPPFGYMKDPNNRTKIVPDPNTAFIVQRIFSLASDGYSCHKIANILTEERLITPLMYRVRYRDNFSEKGAERATDIWSHTTVKRILNNPVYLGSTILGKTKKASIKSKKKISLPKDQWCITENTHEALITKEEFDKSKYYMGMNTTNWRKNDRVRISIFNGITFCANCGSAMCSSGSVYKGEREKYWYLSCLNIPKRSNNHCEHGARIKYTDLIELIKQELNQLISLTDDEVGAITKAAVGKNGSKTYVSTKDRIISTEKRLSQIDKIITKLYNDNAEGLIDDNRLSTMVKDLTLESNKLKGDLAQLLTEQSLSEEQEIKDAYDSFFKLVKQYSHIDELSGEIVRTFIERIEIGEKILPEGYKVATHDIPYEQSIKIVYRFIGDGKNGLKSHTVSA